MLVLPLTADLFPGISGRQITGVQPSFAPAGSGARFLLDGDARLALSEGRILSAPGLGVGGPAWNLVLDGGDKAALTGFALMLAYRAR
ncbi:hypothetical protein ACFQ0B_43565 [Nonomuraea thailandensis]